MRGTQEAWSETEYAELVNALLHFDIESGRQSHPYVNFERVIIDSDLDKCTDYIDWLTKSHAKHAKNVI